MKALCLFFHMYYLFLKILENKIWKFGRNLPLVPFGSERVKRRQSVSSYTEGQSFSVKIAKDWVLSIGWFRLYKYPPTGAVC